MDYKKLAADLLSGCEENCADCEYNGDSEFECTIAQLAATAITDLLARAEAAERQRDRLREVLDMYGGEYGITAMLKQKEAAEARVHELETTHRVEMCEDGYDCVELGKVRRKLEEAEAENKKLLDAMLHIRKTENLERCKVIYEMDFADALDHEIVSNIASMVFRGLMEADIKRRGKKEE